MTNTKPSRKNADSGDWRIIGHAHPHESAHLHVQGAAPFLDDYPVADNTLHAAIGYSTRAHARIRRLDLTAVKNTPGVVAVVTIADIPGNPDIGPVLAGDLLFADGKVEYAGQPLFAVAANDLTTARTAAAAARVEYEDLPAILTLEQALAKKSFIIPEKQFHVMRRGDSDAAIAAAPQVLRGDFRCNGQEHFSLEGHIAHATPTENGTMHVFSSTQNPTEIQHTVAAVLALQMRHVTVEVRRMGGAFGGKETQAAYPACIAALLAQRLGKPVKLRMPRRDDSVLTGKRHPFLGHYEVGISDDGVIAGVNIALAADCGVSADLSLAILDRALFHADNAYYYPHARIVGLPCKTNTPSNTAFRGFGGPQGMLLAENMITDIARAINRDPLEVRRANLYRRGKLTTPYHQKVSDNIAPQIIRELAHDSSYATRRREVDAFNRGHADIKKGLALTPVKFGISFTTCFLNQAAALVHIYHHDGGIHLNHGGTEMGQGLFVKVAQVVAQELGVKLGRVQCSAARTDKSPNTSATAASAGADLNGMAALNAAQKLRRRLTAFIAAEYGVDKKEVTFANDEVRAGKRAVLSFTELAKRAYLARVSMSATGFYRTPKIHYDRARARGRPFFYYTYGAAVSEVLVDRLSGEHRLLRVDILHDVGRSMNPAVDLGQVEGGFVQGMGWMTCEEVVRDGGGRLLSDGPATYKIPAVSDVPEDFRARLRPGKNSEQTVFRSKAVGEPPLMLAMSVWAALEDAVRACGNGAFKLPVPATPEHLLRSIELARQSPQTQAVNAATQAEAQAAARVMRRWLKKTTTAKMATA